MRIDRRQCSFRSVAYIRLHNGTRQSTARVRTPRTRNENQQDEYATRCAPSFNEQHKRKRSHVILNEGPSSLPVPSCSLFLPSSLVHLLVVSIFFRLLLPYSFPRQLVGSNLCLSLSLLVWFVGSRLGTVITGYPALTSVTLVVLSPRTTRGTMRSILGRSKEDPTSRLLASPLLLPPFASNLLLFSLSCSLLLLVQLRRILLTFSSLLLSLSVSFTCLRSLRRSGCLPSRLSFSFVPFDITFLSSLYFARLYYPRHSRFNLAPLVHRRTRPSFSSFSSLPLLLATRPSYSTDLHLLPLPPLTALRSLLSSFLPLLASLSSSPPALTTCVLLAIQSGRKGSLACAADVLIR